MGIAAQAYTLAHFANQAYQGSPDVSGWSVVRETTDAATGFAAVA